MSFALSNTVSPNRVFLVQKSELEKRLDAEYYIPSLVALEKKVLAKNPKKLREYVYQWQARQLQKQPKSYYTDKKFYGSKIYGFRLNTNESIF